MWQDLTTLRLCQIQGYQDKNLQISEQVPSACCIIFHADSHPFKYQLGLRPTIYHHTL